MVHIDALEHVPTPLPLKDRPSIGLCVIWGNPRNVKLLEF